jgi:hypothetical protein
MKPKNLRLLVFVSLLLGLNSIVFAAAPGVSVPKADLERLTGSYANQEMGFAFTLDLQGDHLRLTITEGPHFDPALLIPTSAVQFRWEGPGLAPGLQVSFQVPEGKGKAESLTVNQPGMPLVVMNRVEK